MGNQNNDEVCGAWVTVELMMGSPSVQRWCGRRDGPCPFPGAAPSNPDEGQRRCGALPGTRMRVAWSPLALQQAHDELVAYSARALSDEPVMLSPVGVSAAIDALRACGAEMKVTDQ